MFGKMANMISVRERTFLSKKGVFIICAVQGIAVGEVNVQEREYASKLCILN